MSARDEPLRRAEPKAPPEFLVVRLDPPTGSWQEVGKVAASNAGAAFQEAVTSKPPFTPGEYRVLPLADSLHIGVELRLHDLPEARGS